MIILNVLLLSVVVVLVVSQDLLKAQFPLYGISEIAFKRSQKLNRECSEQLKTLNNALKKTEAWALQMLDSSGSPVNGFMWGNNYWLGSYSQCVWMMTNKPKFFSLYSQISSSPFEVGFYISLFRQKTSFLRHIDAERGVKFFNDNLVHLGLCLPLDCSFEDLKFLLVSWSQENPLNVQNLYNFSLEFQSIRQVTRDFSWTYSPITITLVLILTIALFLTISGTIYDIYIWSPLKKKKITANKSKKSTKIMRNIEEYSDILIQDNNLNEYYEVKMDNSQHKYMPVHVIKAVQITNIEKEKPGFWTMLFLCFSAKSNIEVIFKAPINSDDLLIVHGLRFLGILWLIWLYSMFHMEYNADNKPFEKLFEELAERIVITSTFSVDMFFFISGFVLAYKYYKTQSEQRKEYHFSIKQKVNEFSLFLFKKYLRITPIYIMVMGMVIISVQNLRKTSLFEIKEAADEICSKFWWRNLGYINNLYKESDMCLSWSWYLSTDMQFFLTGLIILILSTRFRRVAILVGGLLIFGSSIIGGYLSYKNKYISTKQPHLALFDVLLYSPWTRIGPYLIGMFTGYFVVVHKAELVVKRMTLVTCWFVAAICNAWALFGIYNENIISTALHTALSRITWGFGLSWIVLACCTGNAKLVKVILSYPGWIPFSKLSYSAYLLGPLIINLIVSNAEKATHLDFCQTIVNYFGYVIITYICAFLLSIILEIPLTTLGKRLIGQKVIQNQLNGPC